MGIVLRVVHPDGTQWGTLGEILPDHVELEFGQDLRGAGSIKFSYPTTGVNVDQLEGETYVVPVIDGNYMWHDSYFHIQEIQGVNLGNEEHSLKTYSGTSLRQKLEKVRWMPAVGSQYMDSLAFVYENVTPGQVIKGGVENYLSRARNQFNDPVHWLTEVRVAGDSSWHYRVDEQIEPGASVSDVITKYQDLGIATARFQGFVLQTAHYDWYSSGLASDKTDSVQFRVGFNVLESEIATSYEDLTTALLVKGSADPFSTDQNPTCVWVQAPAKVMQEFGYREDLLEIGDATQHSTLKAIGEANINSRLEPRFSRTYKIVDRLFDPRSGRSVDAPNAFKDFQCGDLVALLDKGGTHEYRIYGITVSFSEDNQSSIALIVNDYWESWAVTFDQRLKRLGG